MSQQKRAKAPPLNLEVHELERNCRPGCNTSSTNPACTCPVQVTVTCTGFRFSS
jgi:hypothetical protein